MTTANLLTNDELMKWPRYELAKEVRRLAERLAHVDKGCANCGGLPHTTDCRWHDPGRLEQQLAQALSAQATAEAEATNLRQAVDLLKADYEGACKLVAQMHAAAIGGKVGDGPRLGVLEDVEAVRAERDAAARSLATTVEHLQAVTKGRDAAYAERDALKAELARVTAERDEAHENTKHHTSARLTAHENEAAARADAARLREALERLYDAVPDCDGDRIVEWKKILWEGLGMACRDARAALSAADDDGALAERDARLVEPLKAQVAMLTEALNEATDAIDAVESEPGRVGGPIFRIDWTRALKLVRDADPAAFILRKQTEAIDEFMQGAEAGLVKRMVSHGPGDDIIGRAVAARDTRVRAAAFASAALEIRASIACAGRDGDPLDADWVEACAETFEGYADGDAAPDDERCRRLLAECATQGVKT